MRTGSRGLQVIQAFESLRLQAYQDGGGVWTIGWGHTGPDVHPGQTIHRAQAEVFLVQDLEKAEREVEKQVKVPLTQAQFDALVSFEFNTGGIGGSTLAKRLNEDDYVGACAELAKWHYDNGRRVKGLLRRRAAEMSLFLAD